MKSEAQSQMKKNYIFFWKLGKDHNASKSSDSIWLKMKERWRVSISMFSIGKREKNNNATKIEEGKKKIWWKMKACQNIVGIVNLNFQ